MKKVMIVLLMISVLNLCACGNTGEPSSTGSGSAGRSSQSTVSSSPTETEASAGESADALDSSTFSEAAKEETADIASYEDTEAEILTADFYDNDEGDPVIRVHFRYTNNQSDPLYLYEGFAVHAYQNGKQLNDLTDVNEDPSSGDSAELIREVRNGESIEGSYAFALLDDSQVDVRVFTPTVDEELLAEKSFSQ